MPKEYIGRIEALDACYNGWNMDAATIEAITVNIGRIPAADVVEVVRCGECIRKNICWIVSADDNWYCADGKRKDGGQEPPKKE